MGVVFSNPVSSITSEYYGFIEQIFLSLNGICFFWKWNFLSFNYRLIEVNVFRFTVWLFNHIYWINFFFIESLADGKLKGKVLFRLVIIIFQYNFVFFVFVFFIFQDISIKIIYFQLRNQKPKEILMRRKMKNRFKQ